MNRVTKTGSALADAVRTVDRLVFDGGIPPTIEKEHVARELQVQPHAPRAVAHEQHVLGRVSAKPLQHGLALIRRDPPMKLKRAQGRQRRREEPQRLDPLREHNRLAAALGYFLQVCPQSLQLRAVAGQRIEVANLFEPHDQLEDVLHSDGRPKRIEADHAVGLGQRVSLALRRSQLQVRVTHDLGRQVGKDLFFSPAEDAFPRQLRKILGRRFRGDAVRVHERKKVHQVFRPVLDRRAGQCPAPLAMESTHDLRRLG